MHPPVPPKLASVVENNGNQGMACVQMNLLNEIFIGIGELLESKAGLPDKVARFVPSSFGVTGGWKGGSGIGPSAPPFGSAIVTH
ncbi:hypothetical protein CEXT_280881 [Caerostris extrusa]|uniref:Uncharacterized protein n=1 Tax=Caerostris extrusa TaxID=172846 RepID=A0AAV4PEE1_CAEEX|nr:hypothetical protein CEXT_280881 [Caerostris extrusa]